MSGKGIHEAHPGCVKRAEPRPCRHIVTPRSRAGQSFREKWLILINVNNKINRSHQARGLREAVF